MTRNTQETGSFEMLIGGAFLFMLLTAATTAVFGFILALVS